MVSGFPGHPRIATWLYLISSMDSQIHVFLGFEAMMTRQTSLLEQLEKRETEIGNVEAVVAAVEESLVMFY